MPARSERILRAKLTAPPAQPTHLSRQRLLDRVALPARRNGQRLLLIRAAAGFGKTTLMLQYLAACRAAGRRVAWLNLDTADNDSERLLAHLATALGDAAGNVFGIIDTINAHTRPLSVFLDEFEHIQDPLVLGWIRQFVWQLPAHAELVIGSRTLPDLGLARLRANGRLQEVLPRDLRFSLDETDTLLRRSHALSLNRRDVQALQQRTEGWPAALHLAALSIESHDDPASFVAAFSGSQSEIAAYLTEDILSRLAPSSREFLLQTSVLSELSGPLCDAVMLRHDSEALLAELDSAHLFVRPLNTQRSRFRHHGLFASFLSDILERESPGTADTLRQRAASWFLAKERPIPAIEHLLATQQPGQAIGIIAAHAADILQAGRVRMLARWLDRFAVAPTEPATRDLLAPYPRLRLAYALALAFNRRYADAVRIADDILSATSGDRTPVAVEASIIRCQAALMTDRMDECFALSRETVDHVPDDEPFQYGLMANILAYCLICASRYDDARSVLSQAMQRHADTRMNFSRTVADGIESMIDLTQGRLGNALARVQSQADRIWISAHSRVGGGKSALDIHRATMLYEADRLDAAERLLTDALSHSNETNTPDALITTHVLLSRMAWATGQREQSRHYLAELEALGKRFTLPRVVANAWLERARQACHLDDVDAARQAAAQVKDEAWPSPALRPFASDVDDPALLRIRLLLIGEDRSPEQAAQALQAQLADALAHQRHRRALKLRLLMAWALHLAGNDEPAAQQLAMAIGFAGREGFMRTILEEGPALLGWLRQQCLRWQDGPLPGEISARFVERLLLQLAADDSDGHAASTNGRGLAFAAQGERRGSATGREMAVGGHGERAGEPATGRSFGPRVEVPMSVGRLGDDAVGKNDRPLRMSSTVVERDDAAPPTHLTRREQDVLHWLAEGLRNRAIAERLQLSETTVKTHLRNIHAKLGVASRTEAIAVARVRGLL